LGSSIDSFFCIDIESRLMCNTGFATPRWLFSALKGGHIPQSRVMPIGNVKIFCALRCIFAAKHAKYNN
jgi:hypothetical protein